MRRLLLLALLLTSACAGPAPAVPPDVAHPERVRCVAQDGFRLWVEPGLLDDDAQEALLDELLQARVWLVRWLGPALAPGDFRPEDEPRTACPSDWEFGPTPPLGVVDVVVLPHGARCHADADGVTLMREHLGRRDPTHELVHYLAGSSWAPLDEGLAVYLTERMWGADKGFPLRQRARAYKDLSLVTWLSPRELATGMSRRDYDVAGAYVAWLIETYGKAKFFAFYAGKPHNTLGVYGVDEDELVGRFWRHIASLDVRHDTAYHGFRGLLQRR